MPNPDGWQRNPDNTWAPPIHAAVQKQWEVPPDVALTIIRDKAVEVTDASGNTVIRMGKLADGTYGLAIFNASGQEVLRLGESGGVNQSLIVKNDAGTEIIRIGEQTDGRFAMRVNNGSGTEVLRLGEQSDAAHDLSVFDVAGNRLTRADINGLRTLDTAGNEIVRLGKQSDAKYNLSVFDTAGTRKIRVGELVSGHGLEAIDASNNTVTLERLSFGTAAARVDTAESLGVTSANFVDLATVGPSATVTIGPLGRALVSITTGFSTPNGSEQAAGFAISGATTVGASIFSAVVSSAANLLAADGDTLAEQQGATYLVTGLNAGSNTFTMKYRIRFTAGGSWYARTIAVQPF